MAFVAQQVGVEPVDLGFYEWSGRTIEYHRAQIRAHLGFRECSVADADTLTGWLAVNVCEAERRPEQVRDELLVRCRSERGPVRFLHGIEGRVDDADELHVLAFRARGR